MHICTTESFRAGIEQIPGKCFMCGHNTMMPDWCGGHCDTCHADLSWDGDCSGMVRTVRQSAGLTRKQIADKAGLKPSTIKKYEWCWPSKRYWKWFISFVHQQYSID